MRNSVKDPPQQLFTFELEHEIDKIQTKPSFLFVTPEHHFVHVLKLCEIFQENHRFLLTRKPDGYYSDGS